MTLILIWLSIPVLLVGLRLNALRRRDMNSERKRMESNPRIRQIRSGAVARVGERRTNGRDSAERRAPNSRREHTPPNAAGDEGRAAASNRPAISKTHTHTDHFDCTCR